MSQSPPTRGANLGSVLRRGINRKPTVSNDSSDHSIATHKGVRGDRNASSAAWRSSELRGHRVHLRLLGPQRGYRRAVLRESPMQPHIKSASEYPGSSHRGSCLVSREINARRVCRSSDEVPMKELQRATDSVGDRQVGADLAIGLFRKPTLPFIVR
jgi:hypothetical protein